MDNNLYDVVIVGAGVAGMTAAIYLKRFGFKVLIIEKDSPGGQVNRASIIENYPGFKSIDGPSLAYNIYEQLMSLHIDYKYGNVIEIKANDDKKTVITDHDIFECKAVVIASGRISRKLKINNENELIGRGISYCAICDGLLFKDRDVCVIGGGNSAIEESLYLAKICKSVTIINRSNQLKADLKLVDLIKKHENIKVLYNSVINTINEKNGILESLDIKENDEIKHIKTSGLFIYIGSEPDTSFINTIDKSNNYIIVDKNMETNIKGIYACGDVINKSLYQITTAVGEASIAANSVKKYLNR